MKPSTVVPLDRLRLRPELALREYDALDELAESIHLDGLCHSLLVKPADADGLHEIICGARRFRALELLAKQGRPVYEIPCFIAGSDAELAKVIENVSRGDTPLWDLGRAYLNLSESGFTQAEIAARIGKTQGHVSTAIRLARRLAAPVVGILLGAPRDLISTQRLLRIAALSDDRGEPDADAQLQLFDNMLAAPDRGEAARRTRAEKDTVWERYQRLKQGKLNRRIDPVYRPFVEALIKYLSGSTAGITT